MYYKDIFTYVFRQTQNEELSKDLTQEIFIAMLKSIDRFDDKKASFKTWLYKIASNKIIDSYRSTYYKYVTVVEEVYEDTLVNESGLEESLELKEDINEILDIVKTFNTNYQQIFRLKVFGDMTFSDIGSLLEMSESTVKTRYYSTIRKIKKLLVVKNNGQ
ncbi:MAG: sigma-70 family RNA polymerase sigma factor [Clostridium sp.]|uniref:RNA polymerase sigma factor n=1 Tax=Clostridium sp. TaxID=1506 RepID=UPI001E36DF9E|nr:MULTISPECIES: sigma-70 family RNA polymerase sigma factor [Clostridia]MCD2501012.1 sigma-70 family RNA polymerase sigma factor [Clostridium sp. NSJ-145]MCI7031061.1 sigma-70 family RNA polymerase sigma factor [Clostridium sp.]MDD7683515.1 sigma-70 family RNA polymerase sigma factor [Clostridium sp.]MDY2580971.1 sigma-70 family RNA polymerase sigma factor [Clostridium sp.]MDY4736659.1 sigma-70 family RNA polymerase sigma factor [Terrisporobacter sp.]